MSSVQAAPLLLGQILVRRTPAGLIKFKIVETEAYHQNDPASHSFKGVTPRTAPMFQAGGRLYVYFTYGMHYCLNIVTGRAGQGEGVLIRAGQPLEGIELMRANRGVTDIKNLANGPGKLAQALGIVDKTLSGKILNPPPQKLRRAGKYADVWLQPGEPVKAKDIVIGPRVGIRRAADAPMRFYIKDNPYVSRL